MKKLQPDIIFFNLARLLILSIFSAIVLFFVVPYSLIKLLGANEFHVIELMKESGTLVVNNYDYVFSFIIVFSPVIISTLIFRFMYLNSEKSGLYRKVSRETLFLSNIYAALILIIIPFFINLVICLVAPVSSSFGIAFTLKFFIVNIIYQLLIFSVSVIIIVSVRSILIESFFITIVLVFPLLINYTVSHSIESLLYGCVMDLGLFGSFLNMSPVYKATINYFNINYAEMIFILVLALLIFKCAMDIFIKNIPDKNSGFIRFNKAKGIFRFIFFAFFALVSIIVSKTSVLILIICTLCNIFICELILNEKLAINKGQKCYFLYTAILIVAFCVIRYDLYEISKKKIYIDEVSSIYIGTDYDNAKAALDKSNKNELIIDFENDKAVVELTADRINKVINFHESLYNKPSKKNNKDLTYIAYKLKNRKKTIRRYGFDYNEIIRSIR